MKNEISAAVLFLTRLMRKADTMTSENVEQFKARLTSILQDRFQNHWYLEQPAKGQGYRCIRINEFEPIDPVLAQAAVDSGLKYTDLGLPLEFTLWVDPSEVCCRFGESIGSYCTIASFSEENKENTFDHLDVERLFEHVDTTMNRTNANSKRQRPLTNNQKKNSHNNSNKNTNKNLQSGQSGHHIGKKQNANKHKGKKDKYHWIRDQQTTKS